MIERENKYHIPSIAVADAIMASHNYLLQQYKGFYEPQSGDLPQNLQTASEGKCLDASRYALYFLAKRYARFFRNLAILDSFDVEPRFFQKKNQFRNPEWSYHTLFIAQDTSDIWYAASPANYTYKTRDLMKPLVSGNIPDLLKKIQEREKGIWPNKNVIASAFSDIRNQAFVIEDTAVNTDNLLYCAITYPGNTVKRDVFYVNGTRRI